MEKKKKFQFGMFLVTIGIVYGDIGTSPLYVMKSIMAGNGGIQHVNEQFIIGSLSLVFWTVTLLTTIKYVLIAMKADNHGEGGIFSLYALVRNHGKWLIFPAMLGGAALLADGVLTPAVTVTTAVEGRYHHSAHHRHSVFRAARRHQQDRRGLWSLHAAVVLFPGCNRCGHGAAASCRFEDVQPHLCHPGPAEPL